MAKHKKTRKPVAPAKFKVGDSVRVKHGIKDVDYPDIPLGGWAGTIIGAHKDDMYTIQWNPETLAAIHPIVKQRGEWKRPSGKGWMKSCACETFLHSKAAIDRPYRRCAAWRG